MSTVVILGAGLGVGVWALMVWLLPPAPALAAVLARTAGRSPHRPILTTAQTRGWTRVGRPYVAVLRSTGLPTSAVRRDLAVLEQSEDDLLAEKAILGLAGLLLPGGIAATVAVTGSVSLSVPFVVAIGCAAAGFVVPDLRVRRRSARRRADFRHALSAYLDLVVISLAGGAGVDSALHDTLAVGRGWAFAQIERALTTARLTRTTPWSTLRQLGRELDVTELTELAASVSLAGTEGARVRQSLSAKAAALRGHELAAAEADASADTERMSVPVVALLLGFLLFIVYPAVSQVLNGL